MMYNKFSVLHWHITDAESFPFVLTTYPNITKYGAYAAVNNIINIYIYLFY